jgi:hypothetical protein
LLQRLRDDAGGGGGGGGGGAAVVGFAFRGDAARLKAAFPGLGAGTGRRVVDCQDLAAARRQALCLRPSLAAGGGGGGGGAAAAGRAGLGLAAVCAAALGARLDKREQCSDWDRRPLLPAQCAYAALDAAVLLALRSALLAVEPDPAAGALEAAAAAAYGSA